MTDRPIFDRFLANKPLLRRFAESAVDGIGDLLDAGKREAAVDRATERMSGDPVVVNETSSEPWWQSRIYVGAITLIVGMLIDVTPADLDIVATAAEGVGALVVLIGRSVKNKGPIDWKRPWTLLGIGR